MSSRRYDTPPRTLGSLEQRLRNLVPDGSLQQRTRRQIGFVAVIAALVEHARDDDGQPLFAIKGGVAVEMLLGLSARATKDLDPSKTPHFEPPSVLEAARQVGALIAAIDRARIAPAPDDQRGR